MPETYIMKKQRGNNGYDGYQNSMNNSGNSSAFSINKSYDSRRYMRVDDLDIK